VVSDTSVTFQLNFFVLTDLRQCLDDGAKFNELVFFTQHSPCSQPANTSSPLLTFCFTTRQLMSSAKPLGVYSTTPTRCITRLFATANTPAVPTGQSVAVTRCPWLTMTTMITTERNWVERWNWSRDLLLRFCVWWSAQITCNECASWWGIGGIEPPML